jgi:hypothetical protein
MAMTREFILDTLLPYRQNPELCAVVTNEMRHTTCEYLTKDGKKCAVGKHMKDGPWQNILGNYECLIDIYKPEEFLTNEALSQNIPNNVWELMQDYHDSIGVTKDDAIKNYSSINSIVEGLERATNFDFSPLKF